MEYNRLIELRLEANSKVSKIPYINAVTCAISFIILLEPWLLVGSHSRSTG